MKRGESAVSIALMRSSRLRLYTPWWYLEASLSNLPGTAGLSITAICNEDFVRTQRGCPPIVHHSAETIQHRSGFNRLPNALKSVLERFQHARGNFIAPELRKELLLGWQVQVLVS